MTTSKHLIVPCPNCNRRFSNHDNNSCSFRLRWDNQWYRSTPQELEEEEQDLYGPLYYACRRYLTAQTAYRELSLDASTETQEKVTTEREKAFLNVGKTLFQQIQGDGYADSGPLEFLDWLTNTMIKGNHEQEESNE